MGPLTFFLSLVLASMLYSTFVGHELKQKEEEAKKELRVLKDCFEKVKKECGQNPSRGNLARVCGLIVEGVAIWGSYSCKPFSFYASGNQLAMENGRARKKW